MGHAPHLLSPATRLWPRGRPLPSSRPLPDSRPLPVVAALLRWRWLSLGVQSAGVLLAALLPEVQLPWPWLTAVIALGALSNLGLAHWQHRIVHRERVAGWVTALDVGLLTALLALSGGPQNPLSIFYLVHVTVTATLTRPAWTWTVVALSSLAFGALFVVPAPSAMEHHHGAFVLHLQGMWLAFTLSAGAIAALVGHVSAALRQEREERAHARHLLALATLAAGAAHEIGNPLATIVIAASELEAELRTKAADPSWRRDVQLIQREVARARAVLRDLASAAGELRGEIPAPVTLEHVLAHAQHHLGDDAGRVVWHCPDRGASVRWPPQAVGQILAQLLRNALQASTPTDPVRCRIETKRDAVQIAIEDQGEGMSSAVLERSTEPFFTTRDGQGMGLGLFIAHCLVEHLGGHLRLSSTERVGTTVCIDLPVAVLE